MTNLQQWDVQPHGPLVKLDAGLFVVDGEIRMPLGNFPRRMTIAALSSGRSAIWSAICVDDKVLGQIEAIGTPAVLVVPGAAHRRDIAPWKARYPKIKVLCPPGAVEKVAEVVHVDATDDAALDDEAVSFEVVPGTGGVEGALVVRRRKGRSLVLNDTLANVRHPRGIGAWIMTRLFGFGAHGPRMPRIAEKKMVKDSAALAEALRRWAVLPGLARVIPSHGDVIETDARGALMAAAARLG